MRRKRSPFVLMHGPYFFARMPEMAKRKRFTKALALRITAVGLFFGLGSFAVMHSIKNKQEKTEVAANQETPETPTNKADDVPVIDPNPENKIAKVSGTDTGCLLYTSPSPRDS